MFERFQSVLMRSSQPLTGPNSKRCKEDERLINSVLGPGKRGYIIDTRTQTLAQAAKVCSNLIEATHQLLPAQIPTDHF
jgi:myotubularin-related protein 9